MLAFRIASMLWFVIRNLVNPCRPGAAQGARESAVEATDGWGNGVRDENGDGNTDKRTDGGGQTWHSF